MKCSNCGAELADGAKFCGECGTKVPTSNKCPECGAVCAPGVKFCSECGHKMSESSAPKPKDDTDTHVMTAKEFFGESTEEEVDDSQNTSCQEIDWDDDVHKSDLEIPLDDDVMGGIVHNLKKLKKKANKGRLLLEGNEGFDHKIDNFLKEFNGRINGENFAPVIKNSAVAMFDYGVKGTGKRGFVITPIGIFYINNTYPKLVNGDMVGGFVPWKIFYKFVKHNEKAHYWFVRSSDILSSNDVDDDVKESCSTPVEDLVEKMYYNGASEDASGLSADVMSDYLECLKKDISCTHEMTAADFFGEGDNDDDDEEDVDNLVEDDED